MAKKIIYFGPKPKPLPNVDAKEYAKIIDLVRCNLRSLDGWTIELQNDGKVNGIDPCLETKRAVLWPMTQKSREWIRDVIDSDSEFKILVFYVAHELAHVCVAHVTNSLLEATADEAEEVATRYWREEGFVNDIAMLVLNNILQR